MKSNDEIVLKVYNSNSEIGSHGYSHKNINDISISELESEINTTNIIFNEITKDNIKYYRPSYGEYSDALFNLGLKVINWNIDPKDWLVKDTNRIYNNVIKNACDGCIVVLHDTYETTVDATKKMIPALNKLGYKVVSISELMNIKNNYGEDNKAISFIK